MENDTPKQSKVEDTSKANDKKERTLRENPTRLAGGTRANGTKAGNLGRFQLPRLTSNGGLLVVPSPPPSRAGLTAKSPRLERRRTSDLGLQGARMEAEQPRNQTNLSSLSPLELGEQSGMTGYSPRQTRPQGLSSQPQKPEKALGTRLSPRLLRRRPTAGSVAPGKIGGESLNSTFPTRRRQSEGIVPIIHVHEGQENLQERVRKFNESLEQSSAKLRKSPSAVEVRLDDDEQPETPDDMLTTPRLPIHRSRSLPSLLPVLNSTELKEGSGEPLSFHEDLKRCRYLRIPGSPKPLTVEEIFQKN